MDVQLPDPQTGGNLSVEAAMAGRRSRRSFSGEEIKIRDLSQILWAAYGITERFVGAHEDRGGFRTAPSAGGLYPLEIYLVAGKVEGLEPGIYRYVPPGHHLTRVMEGDVRDELSAAALGQEPVREAAACLLYSVVYDRNTGRYGERGSRRYVCMDVGHSAQNVYLQAESLRLGTCAIGAFNDHAVKEVMQLPDGEEPMYIMPIGKYKSGNPSTGAGGN
ncbi:MAG: SagB/ThcOx family dehydrogenase [Bacteroidales bacterium]